MPRYRTRNRIQEVIVCYKPITCKKTMEAGGQELIIMFIWIVSGSINNIIKADIALAPAQI
jgi:hypothetical protein